jgi:hypothetical protein
MKAELVVAHFTLFEEPLTEATHQANMALSKYLIKGGLRNAWAFERAAERQQVLAYKEEAARNLQAAGLLGAA